MEAAEGSTEDGRGLSQPPKPVVLVAARKSTPGVSAAQKQAKVEGATNALGKERELWANTGKVGYLLKKEMSGMCIGPRWKPMFCMLNMATSELEVYAKADSAGRVGQPKGRPREVLALPNRLQTTPLFDRGKSGGGRFVLELKDPSSGTVLQLGCKSETERNEWAAAITRCAEGFKPSTAAQKALDEAKALVVQATTHGSTLGDISSLPAAAQEQLVKIDSLLQVGLLSRAEVDQLLPVIRAQASQMMSAQHVVEADRVQVHAPASNFDELRYRTHAKPSTMVMCDVCSILNADGGTHCIVCSAKLPSPCAP
jgi:hypothetical protein